MHDYWIKMRTNLDTDPNVVFVANKLGIDIFSLIGRLHKFWSWANSHASAAGSLHRTSAAWIDHFVSCQGFSDALISVGWLLVRRDFLILPQWDRHNGPPAQARAGEAIRKKMQRANGENSKKVGSDENVRTNIQGDVQTEVDRRTEPKIFCPENVRTREEKRRVEKNIINTHTPTARARPPSLEEAVSYAESKPGYKSETVQHWFSQRDSQGWIKANNQPVTNWKSDLDAWVLSERHRQPMPQQVGVSRLRIERRTEDERDKAITGFDPIQFKTKAC